MSFDDKWNPNAADRFWEQAVRDAYYSHPQGPGLNAIEQAALLPLVAQHWRRPLADRDTAAIPELRDDGAAVLVKLTLDRVERWAAAYDAHEAWTAQQFSFPADA